MEDEVRDFRETSLPRLLSKCQNGQKVDPSDLVSVLETSHRLLKDFLQRSKSCPDGGEGTAIKRAQELVRECDAVVAGMTSQSQTKVFLEGVPRIVPKILDSVFSFCNDVAKDKRLLQVPESEDRKRLIKAFYASGKILLESYGNFMEKCVERIDGDRDLEIVLEGLKIMASLLQILPNFDFDGFGKCARTFVKQCQRNKPYLRGCLEVEVLFGSMCQLALENCPEIDETANKPDETSVKRLTFILKCVKEVCDVFCDCLGRDFQDLCFLVVRIFGIHERLPQDSEIKKTFASLVLDSAKSCLETLLMDKNFCSFVLSRRFESPDDQCGRCQLYGFLLSRLPDTKEDYRRMWMLSQDDNLFRVAIDSSSNCAEFNSSGPVSGVEGNRRKVQRVTAYEDIASLVQSFIMGANAREMEVVEVYLLSTVLKDGPDDFWPKRIASDVWCFIARYGPSSYCFQHVSLLAAILKERPELLHHRHLSHLAQRLSSFLTASDARKLQSSFDPSEEDLSNFFLWSCLSLSSCEASFKRSLFSKALEHLDKFSDGEDEDFNLVSCGAKLLRKLWNDDQTSSEDRCSVTIVVMKVWRKMHLGHYPLKSTAWCINLFKSVVRLTGKVLVNAKASDANALLRHLKGVLDVSAGESYLCYLIADMLPSVKVNSVEGANILEQIWLRLFSASTTDALLEWKVSLSFSVSANVDESFLPEAWKEKQARFISSKECLSSVGEGDVGHSLGLLHVKLDEGENYENCLGISSK